MHRIAVAIGLAWFGVAAAATTDVELARDPAADALTRTAAPVTVAAKLAPNHIAAAREGRLKLKPVLAGTGSGSTIPVQWEAGEPGSEWRATFLLPADSSGRLQLNWSVSETPVSANMRATTDPASGQIDIVDDDKPVLRYNYQTIEPGEVLEKVRPPARIYARARSDYIHPLYGISGEVLTRDWAPDHPHHRGIPEPLRWLVVRLGRHAHGEEWRQRDAGRGCHAVDALRWFAAPGEFEAAMPEEVLAAHQCYRTGRPVRLPLLKGSAP